MGGAQEVYGVQPDLCLLGKVPSGGLPVAMIAGGEVMQVFDAANFGADDFGLPGPNLVRSRFRKSDLAPCIMLLLVLSKI